MAPAAAIATQLSSAHRLMSVTKTPHARHCRARTIRRQVAQCTSRRRAHAVRRRSEHFDEEFDCPSRGNRNTIVGCTQWRKPTSRAAPEHQNKQYHKLETAVRKKYHAIQWSEYARTTTAAATIYAWTTYGSMHHTQTHTNQVAASSIRAKCLHDSHCARAHNQPHTERVTTDNATRSRKTARCDKSASRGILRDTSTHHWLPS
jgi:hypothetical protein